MSATPLLTLAELHVLLDATTGSLALSDDGALFRYARADRERIVNAIVERMRTIPLTVEAL